MNYLLAVLVMILSACLFYIVKDPVIFLAIMIGLSIEKILDVMVEEKRTTTEEKRIER